MDIFGDIILSTMSGLGHGRLWGTLFCPPPRDQDMDVFGDIIPSTIWDQDVGVFGGHYSVHYVGIGMWTSLGTLFLPHVEIRMWTSLGPPFCRP